MVSVIRDVCGFFFGWFAFVLINGFVFLSTENEYKNLRKTITANDSDTKLLEGWDFYFLF